MTIFCFIVVLIIVKKSSLIVCVTFIWLGVLKILMLKNRLQVYTQRSSLPLTIYQTINEGYSHAPKFRSIVLVEGDTYTSISTFAQRKAAEEDVARLALEYTAKKQHYPA
ncbi:dsrm domain-containing protein [Cephalotus follicularis]|uniref:Dsrm domain-containing protein n=1 Tax=Cephalotus follicularis TaxID=3775 RepID=A0A1Q3BBV7_CEPFO|nr:dsrm domain-containing protein [Cephalotus follicularis]